MNVFLAIAPVAAAYAELQATTGDERAIAYRFTLGFLVVTITHVPTGTQRVVGLFGGAAR